MKTKLNATLPALISSAPLFSAMDIAYQLADILDLKAGRKGRAATREEKEARVLLTAAMNAAEIDTIASGAYTFTIDTEMVTLTAEDGSEIEAEMDMALTVHRAKKPAVKAPQRVSNRQVSMRDSMTAALSDDAPASGVVSKAA